MDPCHSQRNLFEPLPVLRAICVGSLDFEILPQRVRPAIFKVPTRKLLTFSFFTSNVWTSSFGASLAEHSCSSSSALGRASSAAFDRARYSLSGGSIKPRPESSRRWRMRFSYSCQSLTVARLQGRFAEGSPQRAIERAYSGSPVRASFLTAAVIARKNGLSLSFSMAEMFSSSSLSTRS